MDPNQEQAQVEPNQEQAQVEPNQEQATDILSNLPDTIVHNILKLSCLSIFDLVELGFSSRRWNRLVITMPYLDINVDLFYHLRPVDMPFDHALIENIRRFINRVLIRQGQSGLVLFRLHSRGVFNEVQILRWLLAVAARNVQELDIEFRPFGGFILPFFIAENNSLTVLRIALVNQVLQLPSVVRLNQLKSVELYQIEFTNSHLIQILFLGCPSLESLRFEECVAQSFSFLDFSSSHLKELTFDFVHHVDFANFEFKVSCSNLVLFRYSAPVAMKYILENVSSLKTAWIGLYGVDDVDRQVGQIARGILKDVHNVTDLHLDMNVVHSLCYVLDELTSQPTLFPRLKSLSLLRTTLNHFTKVMFLLVNHCPNLVALTLISEEFEDAEWNEHWELQYEGIVSWKFHPHMKTMKFVGFHGVADEMNLLSFILKNARNLEKLEIVWAMDADIF